jgi:hypothetical protein
VKNYLRHDGYRHKRVDVQMNRSPAAYDSVSSGQFDRFVSYGWACARDRNSPTDRRVEIWFRPTVGYFSKPV